MGRVAALEVCDLAVEVFFLVGGADSRVDDLFLLDDAACVAEELEDVVSEVETFSAGEAFAGDSSTFCPSSQGRV